MIISFFSREKYPSKDNLDSKFIVYSKLISRNSFSNVPNLYLQSLLAWYYEISVFLQMEAFVSISQKISQKQVKKKLTKKAKK